MGHAKVARHWSGLVATLQGLQSKVIVEAGMKFHAPSVEPSKVDNSLGMSRQRNA